MASTLDLLEVVHEGKRYKVTMYARMQTDAAAAYRVFTDYERLPEINDAIIEARVLPDESIAPMVRLRTQVRVCIVGICRVFEQLQDMLATPPESLRADVLPEHSNLKFGWAAWRIWQEGDEARLLWEAEIEPDFWVPPLIGPWLIKRKLQQEAIDTANGIERLANAL